MDDMTVLLVEDNPDEEFLTLRVLRKILGLAKIDVARDGVEALSYLAGETGAALPALVLLDLKLPRVGGADVLREMRSRERTRAVPVVVLSSSDHDNDISLCIELGAASYLLKPLGTGAFAAVLGSIGIVAGGS
ncbi:MAG: response regulator [Desulfuromonadales bacterium]|nr:MAG: response regulator [Desulfuromonadales bacterium]